MEYKECQQIVGLERAFPPESSLCGAQEGSNFWKTRDGVPVLRK